MATFQGQDPQLLRVGGFWECRSHGNNRDGSTDTRLSAAARPAELLPGKWGTWHEMTKPVKSRQHGEPTRSAWRGHGIRSLLSVSGTFYKMTTACVLLSPHAPSRRLALRGGSLHPVAPACFVSPLHMWVIMWTWHCMWTLECWEHLLCSNPEWPRTRKTLETAPASRSGPVAGRRGPDAGSRMVGLTKQNGKWWFVFITQTMQ